MIGACIFAFVKEETWVDERNRRKLTVKSDSGLTSHVYTPVAATISALPFATGVCIDVLAESDLQHPSSLPKQRLDV
jgi:hypothetical protein